MGKIIRKIGDAFYITNEKNTKGKNKGYIKIEPSKFVKRTMTIRKFIADWAEKIQCSPVGQRLDTTPGPEKREGIIRSILCGIDIGEITIVENGKDEISFIEGFKYDSLDGGHRKRYIIGFEDNQFTVDGVKLRQFSDDERKQFLDYEITLVVYEPMDVFTKGYIFRTKNKTTDVNHQEMLNSHGDVPIANLIRETVRTVIGVDNTHHELFEQSGVRKKDKLPDSRYLVFNNLRLKIDELNARIVFRLTQDNYLGASSDSDLENMYLEQYKDEDIKSYENKLKEHYDFLLKCSVAKVQVLGKGKNRTLTMNDFKLLSWLRFYMLDEHGSFKVDDCEEFMRAYVSAFVKLTNKNGIYGKKYITDYKLSFDKTADRMVTDAFIGYLGAPDHAGKIKQSVLWLLDEFDYKKFITITDKKRGYSERERTQKLVEQNFKCYVTGKTITLANSHAAHLKAHGKGNKSTYDNFVMVEAIHNTDMGSIDLEDYKKLLVKNNLISKGESCINNSVNA